MSTDFASLTFGTAGPVPAKLETIVVEIDPTIMVDQYAEAFSKETYRVAPLIAERVKLTPEEMKNYSRFILLQRVLSVKGECTLFRKLKPLYIPSFLQYAISMVGEVDIRSKGLRLVPSFDEEVITLEEALAISDKIKAFADYLQIVQDAMPRDAHGDVDVMSTALIAGYAMSIEKVEHESSAYVSAFLGFKLQEELAFRVLYRTQYDDIGYMTSAILSRKELL
jgi:hypothetical protein